MLYHIGKRPAEPKESAGYGEKYAWRRYWLEKPIKSGVFLTPNPTDIVQWHGVSGNVYAYKIPEWVVKKAGGIHRYDHGSEILISEEIWDEAGDEIEFLGKSMTQDQLWDTADPSIAATMRGAERAKRRPGKVNIQGLFSTSHPEQAIKMMTPAEREEAMAYFEEKYPEALKGDPFEVEWEKVPGERKGYRKDFLRGELPIRKQDQKIIDLLKKHMTSTNESIMENWRRYLSEDLKKRKAFAQDLEAAGRTDDSWVDDPRGSSEERKADMKKIMAQGRDLKKAFAKNADRKFLDSLVTVHWSGKQSMINMLLGKLSTRDELSCAAYLPGAEVQGGAGKFGRFGIVIKGHITLLANDMDQIYSGAGEAYTDADPQRTKMSGANKGAQQIYEPGAYEEYKILVLDKEDWKPDKAYRGNMNNEALVDNWSPMALIVPSAREGHQGDVFEPEADKMTPKPGGADTMTGIDFVEKFEKLVKKAGLDIPVMSSGEFKRQWN